MEKKMVVSAQTQFFWIHIKENFMIRGLMFAEKCTHSIFVLNTCVCVFPSSLL